MGDFLLTIGSVWQEGVEWTQAIFGTGKVGSNILLALILIWLISLLILVLHRRSLRKERQAKINLTASVDDIIYQLAKAQYSLSENQQLQFDPCFALMKTMFESGHFEYLDNITPIKENIKKVEVLLHQAVISEDQRKKIDSQKLDLKRFQSTSKGMGYILNVVTLGIYNLFR